MEPESDRITRFSKVKIIAPDPHALLGEIVFPGAHNEVVLPVLFECAAGLPLVYRLVQNYGRYLDGGGIILLNINDKEHGKRHKDRAQEGIRHEHQSVGPRRESLAESGKPECYVDSTAEQRPLQARR